MTFGSKINALMAVTPQIYRYKIRHNHFVILITTLGQRLESVAVQVLHIVIEQGDFEKLALIPAGAFLEETIKA